MKNILFFKGEKVAKTWAIIMMVLGMPLLALSGSPILLGMGIGSLIGYKRVKGLICLTSAAGMFAMSQIVRGQFGFLTWVFVGLASLYGFLLYVRTH